MLKIKIAFILTFLTSAFVFLSAQTAREEIFEKPEKAGGIYYAYPDVEKTLQTAPPKGYKPFYVSHFGRHGSRYLTKDSEYKDVLDLLEKASRNNVLTPLGEDILQGVREIWEEAENRGGDLSPLGIRQHQDIAERMYQAFSAALTGPNVYVTARSTPVIRCVLSMDAFCERLKEFNPCIHMSRDASARYNKYLNYHTNEAVAFRYAPDTWREEYNKFEVAHVKGDRIANLLFSDKDYITKQVNLNSMVWGLYTIAVGMQNIESSHSFLDLFEKQELFDMWQCSNYRQYVQYANYALNKGLMMENAKPLLKDMIDRADEAIESGRTGADLRFGHDGNIVPLAMLMHLEGCYNSVSEPSEFYKAWTNFKVTPMAGNIQIIFFRKSALEDILVKFLLHENEIILPELPSDKLPYYNWNDVKNYYSSLLD